MKPVNINTGDSICHTCGVENPAWYADNELFNKINGSPNGVYCPLCFQKMADKAGLNIIFKVESIMEQTKAKTAEDLLFDLAVSEYCKESEQDGFLFGEDRNGCSLEKSNGYNCGFLNGFEKGYLHQQSHIANLKAEKADYKKQISELQSKLSDERRLRLIAKKTMHEATDRYSKSLKEFCDHNSNLEIQNKELREALKKIVKIDAEERQATNTIMQSTFKGYEHSVPSWLKIAEQALKEDKKDEK